MSGESNELGSSLARFRSLIVWRKIKGELKTLGGLRHWARGEGEKGGHALIIKSKFFLEKLFCQDTWQGGKRGGGWGHALNKCNFFQKLFCE